MVCMRQYRRTVEGEEASLPFFYLYAVNITSRYESLLEIVSGAKPLWRFLNNFSGTAAG